MKKKVLFALIAAIVFAFGAAAVGCGEEKPPELHPELTISQTAVSVEEFKSVTLSVTKKDIADDVAVTWTSSDETVAKVDGGVVSALKAGTAVITATAGETTAICDVTVTRTDIMPAASVDHPTVAIGMGDTFGVSATVMWDGTLDLTDSAEYKWESGDEEIATVTKGEGGAATINALKPGTATVTLTAKVREREAYATIAVTVNPVYLNFAVANDDYTLSESGYSVNLYTVSAGSGEGKTATAPIVSATYKGEAVTDYEMAYSIVSGEEFVGVDASTGEITAIKPGVATVKGITTYRGVASELVFNVTVNRSVVEESDVSVKLNRTGTVTIGTKADGEQSAKLIVGENESATAFTVSESSIVINHSDFAFASGRGVAIPVIVRTELVDYEFDVTIVDYAIADKAEFMAWYANYPNDIEVTGGSREKVDKYIELEADIDFGGSDLGNKSHGYWYYASTAQSICFVGTFDGKGHTLSDFTAMFPIFPGIEGATIKNVSMIDYKITGNYALVAISMYSGTIENCYFEGVSTGTKAAFFDNFNGGTLTNVSIVAHDYAGASKLPSIANTIQAGAKASGLYVVDYNGDGTLAKSNNLPAGSDAHVYTDLNTGITELPAAFDPEVWTVSGGVIMTKAAKAYYDAFSADKSLAVNPISVIRIDDEVTLGATFGGATASGVEWTFDGLDEGQYTFEGGKLTVTDTGVAGSEVTLNAKLVVNGVLVYSDSLTLTVKNKIVNKTLDEVVVGKNRAAADTAVTVDADETFVALYVNDVVSESATVTISGTTATIPSAVTSALAVGSHVIKIETDKTVYSIPVTVADFAIGTADEFTDWYKNKYAANLDKTIVLTADITLDSSVTYSNARRLNFAGVFDGRGHTVANFTATAGFIDTMSGTMKNVAFVNVKQTGMEGFIGHQLVGNAKLINVYYQGVNVQTTADSGVSRSAFYPYLGENAKPTVENVVIILERNVGSTTDTFSSKGFDNFLNNVYAVNTCSKGTTASQKANVYTSVADFVVGVTSLPTGFDSSLWTIDPTVGLTFKSATPYFPSFAAENILKKGDASLMSQISGATASSTGLDGLTVYEKTLSGVVEKKEPLGLAKTFGSTDPVLNVSGYAQYALALKVNKARTMIDGLYKLPADQWVYLWVNKQSDGKFHLYYSQFKIGGYSEYVFSSGAEAYRGWLSSLESLLRFSGGTLNEEYVVSFTDVYVVTK